MNDIKIWLQSPRGSSSENWAQENYWQLRNVSHPPPWLIRSKPIPKLNVLFRARKKQIIDDQQRWRWTGIRVWASHMLRVWPSGSMDGGYIIISRASDHLVWGLYRVHRNIITMFHHTLGTAAQLGKQMFQKLCLRLNSLGYCLL